MIKFEKIKDKNNKFDNTNVTIESQSITLDDLLEDFTDFLRACGYIVDGTICIVKDDD